MKVLTIRHISKVFGYTKVLDDINISFEKGKIYGLVGKNGAGKTTLLKICSKVTNPSEGKIIQNSELILGCSIGECFYEDLTIIQNIELQKRLIDKEHLTNISELLETFNLWEVKDKEVSVLSLGMKQLVAIALALVGEPNFIVLDEPLNGLDPINTIQVRNTLKEYCDKHKVTMIISSHDLSELSKIATTFIIINEGKILKQLDKNELPSDDSLEILFHKLVNKEELIL